VTDAQTYDAGVVAHDVGHGSVVLTAVLSFSEPVDGEALSTWLETLVRDHGGAIVSIKGVVLVAGEDRPIGVLGAQHTIQPPKFLAEWPAGLAHSTIAFTLNGLDGATLHDSALAAGLPVLMTGVETHPLHVLG
jgi:G3E family GTPase